MVRMTTDLALDDPVRSVVRVLMAVTEESQADLTQATGIPKSTLIRRMARGGWTVRELQALSRHFGVEPEVLLGGPERLLTIRVERRGSGGTTSGWSGRSRQDDALANMASLAA